MDDLLLVDRAFALLWLRNLYSPYEYPTKHWELDESGQPTQQIIDRRRRAEFITPRIGCSKKGLDAVIYDAGNVAETFSNGKLRH